MKSLIAFFAVLLSSLALFAQHEADNWFFGDSAGLSFRDGTPKSVRGGRMTSYEGCAAMSDRKTGKLLFYSNGLSIWDADHNTMPNGYGLLGGMSASQSALIVPFRKDSYKYFVFTAPDRSNLVQFRTQGLFVNVVDMRLNGGKGDLTEKHRPLISESVAEKVAATIDCGNKGYWVVAHDEFSNSFYSFHINEQDDIGPPVESRVGTTLTQPYMGCLKISPNGKYIAMSCYTGSVELFDFDNSTGIISNPRLLTPDLKTGSSHYYGVTFSPDNSKLYFSEHGEMTQILQYDLNTRQTSVVYSAPLETGYMTSLQIGPDRRVYFAVSSETGFPPALGDSAGRLGIIHFPNRPGNACSATVERILLYGVCYTSLPNFMDHIFNEGKMDLRCAAPEIILHDYTACTGEELNIEADADNYPETWEWSFTGAGIETYNGRRPPTLHFGTPGKYRFTLITGNAYGKDTLQRSITVFESPAGVDERIVEICRGEMKKIGVRKQANILYSWEPALGLSDNSLSDPLAGPSEDQLYYFSALDTVSGCRTRDSVFVKVSPRHRAFAGEDISICPGGSAQLGRAPDEGLLYSWTPAWELSDPSIANPLARPSVKTQYILTTTDILTGCSSLDTVLVDVGRITVKTSPSISVCSGEAVQLSASGGERYLWSPGESLSDPAAAAPLATPSETTRYRVLVYSGDCLDSGFVTVTVHDRPAPYAGQDTLICAGDAVQLGSAPEPGFQYKWSPAEGLSADNIANPAASPGKSTRYYLTVTNGNGCSATDSVLLDIGNSYRTGLAESTELCKGESILLEVSQADSYRWFTKEDPELSRGRRITVAPHETTLYYVQASVGNCSRLDSIQVSVKQRPQLSAGTDRLVCAGESIGLSAQGDGIEEWRWSPAALFTDPGRREQALVVQESHEIVLAGRSGNGCWGYDTLRITASPADILNCDLRIGDRNIAPGDEFRMRLRLSTESQAFSAFTVRIGYDRKAFRFVENSLRANTSGWSLSAQSDKGELRINATGSSATLFEGELVFFGMLTVDEPAPFTVQAGHNAPCSGLKVSEPEIDYGKFCGRGIRPVSFSGYEFSLSEPAPNPASDILMLRFSIAYTCPLAISLVNSMGAEISLVEDAGIAPGKYERSIPAENIPSGLYFLRMRAGEFQALRKIIIAK